MFHQELHHATLRATAKAFITVALRVNNKRSERTVIMERAQSLVSDPCLLQSGAVARAITSEAVLNHLLDLRRIKNLVDNLLVDFRHSRNIVKLKRMCVRVARVCVL